MNPIIVLPPDTMSKEDIEKLSANGLCVVVAAEPARVRFLDPIPAIASRTEVENAAIQLSRKVITPGFWAGDETRKLMASHFMDILVRGSPLDPRPSQDEVEKNVYDDARAEEIRKMAREDARADRLARQKAAEEEKRKAAEQKQPASGKK